MPHEHPNPLIPPRQVRAELLDIGVGAERDVALSMRDLARINALLGGRWSLTRHLYPRVRGANRPLTVVDLGAGDGDLAKRLARWRTVGGYPVRVVAADLLARHLALLPQDANVLPIQADALALPLARCHVDYLVSSLLLHHLEPDQIVALLHRLWRTARCGLIMSDLVRGHLPEMAWHIARPVLARSWITSHDAVVSIRRSYTPDELRGMAHQAGIPGAQVVTQFPWRMTLIADKYYV